MFEVVQYHTTAGSSPFETWFNSLNRQAALKVNTSLTRIEDGNFGDVKPVGAGVSETRIHFGPGYRIYTGKEGDKVIVLLGGGTKKGQSRDIKRAKERWTDYKARKRRERNATD